VNKERIDLTAPDRAQGLFGLCQPRPQRLVLYY
jgi:hypothetical protein